MRQQKQKYPRRINKGRNYNVSTKENLVGERTVTREEIG